MREGEKEIKSHHIVRQKLLPLQARQDRNNQIFRNMFENLNLLDESLTSVQHNLLFEISWQMLHQTIFLIKMSPKFLGVKCRDSIPQMDRKLHFLHVRLDLILDLVIFNFRIDD
jgi:hypothetical protein